MQQVIINYVLKKLVDLLVAGKKTMGANIKPAAVVDQCSGKATNRIEPFQNCHLRTMPGHFMGRCKTGWPGADNHCIQ